MSSSHPPNETLRQSCCTIHQKKSQVTKFVVSNSKLYEKHKKKLIFATNFTHCFFNTKVRPALQVKLFNTIVLHFKPPPTTTAAALLFKLPTSLVRGCLDMY